ncbi:MAG TPA: septal ring lytic transglycosylase RlpA family lipoprotein [Gammaproteobacteria bacterium]|nr:septal ring lytic transglycosylase RlpA family lipoprotein [Gammaproteobacteria bacterium]
MPTNRVCMRMTDPVRLPAAGLCLAGLAFIVTCFTACSTKGPLEPTDDAPLNPRDVSDIPNAVPRYEPLSRYGNPASYVVYGKRYHTLSSSKGYKEQGMASWYGTKFHGKRTSSGEPYDLYAMTAAHKTLPLPTYVEVTNLGNDRSVIVKVNDRGPFHDDRLIDLSYTAAVKLGIVGNGTGHVEVAAIDAGTPAKATATAPLAAPVVPAATSHPGDTALYLQVGAFSNRENAERLQGKIQTQDVGAVRIVESSGDNGTFYKVQVGPLSDATELDRVAKTLKPLGINESRAVTQ